MLENSDRGQAITLEGFIASMVILMSLLLALQSAVITPSTGGAIDRTVQSQLQHEAKDALLVSETITEDDNGTLTRFLLYYDEDEGKFHNANQALGAGYPGYNSSGFEGNVSIIDGPNRVNPLGTILHERFDQQGWSYNLHLVNETGYEHRVVYQGEPTENAFTASYLVTLYDDNRLLESDGTEDPTPTRLRDLETPPERSYIFPDAEPGGPVYGVVEVRLTVW
ncbi:MAG: hypothetical protein U5K37_06785 [Natrialbaceae archaeon]|nr:hypothetical protein [Natrialbaceae archaeon]